MKTPAPACRLTKVIEKLGDSTDGEDERFDKLAVLPITPDLREHILCCRHGGCQTERAHGMGAEPRAGGTSDDRGALLAGCQCLAHRFRTLAVSAARAVAGRQRESGEGGARLRSRRECGSPARHDAVRCGCADARARASVAVPPVLGVSSAGPGRIGQTGRGPMHGLRRLRRLRRRWR